MSGVKLAKPYAVKNYTKALENLTQRYQKNQSKVHFSDTAFNGLSEDQARSALKFFGDIGLIENPKRGHYTPTQSVVTWQQSIEGPAKDEAKQEVIEKLKEYTVFDEAIFLLENSGNKKVSALAIDIGGKIGIQEDNLSKMERTIEVLAGCDFLEIDEENVVSLAESNQNEEKEPVLTDYQSKTDGGDSVEDGSNDSEPLPQTEPKDNEIPKAIGANIDLSIEIDATEMEPGDLKKKLEIIGNTASYDEE